MVWELWSTFTDAWTGKLAESILAAIPKIKQHLFLTVLETAVHDQGAGRFGILENTLLGHKLLISYCVHM